jgi:diguanylate cyclase (GGDEF)-like protein
MAAGAAFPTIADALVRLASAEAMGWRAALLIEGRHGRTVFAGTLPPALFATGASAPGGARRVAPWDRALETGDGVTVAELDALAPEVADRASALGLVGCVTVGVHDNDSQAGALVVWFESGATTTVLPLWLEHEVEPLLRLALEQHQARAQLEWAARFDALTGLPNRGHLLDEVSRALARCRRGTTAAVLYLDLDGFKAVNDEHGHLAGDEVLVTASHRLRNEIRPGDLIGRLGGDEFVLVCPGCHGIDEVEAIGSRMVEAMRSPITLAGGGEARVGVSVGAVLVGPRAPTVEEALARADGNLYRAKASGRGCVVASVA